MKKLAMIFTLVAVLFPCAATAKDNEFGLGIILGEPTGISLKKWIGSTTAIDGAIAWSFGNGGSFHLHADYLFHNFSLFDVERGKLPLYYGIGIRIKAKKKSKLGVRIPIGICYIFEKTPLDVFLELGPLLDLAPSVRFGFTGSIGARYYF